ncbi:MAG: type II toxin-antitoxin system VapC family toxin [Angustibacter sp.]
MRPFLLDVNVLLAAFRQDHPQHSIVRPWFDEAVTSPGVAVPAMVWTSFVRLATHRRVFDPPACLADVFAFVDAVRAQPDYLVVDPGPRHLMLLRQLCEESDATGDLVPDAAIGALAVEHGCTVASLDRDFARFASVSHVIPAGD